MGQPDGVIIFKLRAFLFLSFIFLQALCAHAEIPFVRHIVQSDESARSLAELYYGSENELPRILRDNDFQKEDQVAEGVMIKIIEPLYHPEDLGFFERTNLVRDKWLPIIQKQNEIKKAQIEALDAAKKVKDVPSKRKKIGHTQASNNKKFQDKASKNIKVSEKKSPSLELPKTKAGLKSEQSDRSRRRKVASDRVDSKIDSKKIDSKNASHKESQQTSQLKKKVLKNSP